MAFFLAPLAPVAKAGLARGGAYLANKFLRKKAKQQFKNYIPLAGGSLPARVGTSHFGKGGLSKIAAGGLAADNVGDFFSPDSEAQAPQIDFDEVNKLVEALNKEKRVSSRLSRADILSGELRRRK